MVIIQDKLVEEAAFSAFFACNLSACKGACCYDGDYGAPIDESELDEISANLEAIKPYLNKESIEIIEKDGFEKYYSDINTLGTNLKTNGDCVFLKREESGIAYCGIEKSFLENKSTFIKPVSCHLYPIRVDVDQFTGFEILTYHRWNICNPACINGKINSIPLYEFVKTGLIRKYGEDFFEEFAACAKHLEKNG
jgi:hypothetical protein